MDHAEDDFDGDIFIYRGGRAPQHVTHAVIDESVDEIEDRAFKYCRRLVQVETHDGIRRIGKYAFHLCKSLRRINLKSVVEIGDWAFYDCENLESVEFGNQLETIGDHALSGNSLTHLKLPSIITIGGAAFARCKRLLDVDLPMGLESMGPIAFWNCVRLQCIAVPPKRGLFAFDDDEQKCNQFDDCRELVTVDLVGQEHSHTVASLHMDSWRTEMIAEINSINQVLPNTPRNEKTQEIQQWMDVIIDKMDHYKAEHYRYVKEGMTFLELALWKAKLGEKEDSSVEGQTKKAKIDSESARKERRITCGADLVIKNVLPFLQLLER